MGTTAPGRATSRAVAVLAVLLGLLAMHGLASTHHAAAAPTAEHVTAQHSADSSAAASPEHLHAAPAAAAQDAEAAPAGPGCDDLCPELAVLCVAVLTGAALLAVMLARRRRATPLPAPAPQAPASRAPPVRHARPPDPVKELCVSRT